MGGFPTSLSGCSTVGVVRAVAGRGGQVRAAAAGGPQPSVKSWVHAVSQGQFRGRCSVTRRAEVATLAGIATPIQLLLGDQSLPYFAQAASRLAKRLGIEITTTSGTHFAYLDHPVEYPVLTGFFQYANARLAAAWLAPPLAVDSAPASAAAISSATTESGSTAPVARPATSCAASAAALSSARVMFMYALNDVAPRSAK